MALPLVVPDASVLLKWVLRSTDEEDAAAALGLQQAWLQGTVEIVVPALWSYEVGHVLGLKQPGGAEALFRAMCDLSLPEAAPQSYSAKIFKLMRDHDVTFYDAAYHALAVVRGGVMVTADQRYAAKCKSAGFVALLSDWRP